MDNTIQTYFENLQSGDKNLQYEAFNNILDATKVEVDWAYEVWDQLVVDLTNSDNHERARAAQFLCSLAKSDPEKRILHEFSAVWEVTKDKKFVTARHSLQSMWKVGLAGTEQKEMVIKHLVNRFNNCPSEKNYTLIRFDIIKNLSNLYEVLNEAEIKNTALNLIEKEEDKKYRKKYSSVFQD
ncbi:hypothetical protein SAMN05216232_0307 [Virgibacillus subterraneus]|uniref:HEAT repeat domain-containing protein n=1 Tax=Virgibacillus subterraneus TaxID=621109 RepID=A0A1H8Z6D3_9BACI|nr:hypothetical protein [Virgibacillus subterraneus]SEP60025.1 hypothetical protein SAMN05216232_0307 [Virgibacillus subterraneus]